ncbi:protein FAR-RED IMPAIRED RESPONSE 1-like [Chenopodium quinoa]|uniref:protein FAR-RED IMPAIRED RESPONSE 1-like n=1 Tax=Chenopodium quinoa TaxID=63459 RepID=UPI000B774AAA|nr:protein FAR-RED IMPAIRED RESPONSE 1-like [Chenopodium quinoa]
MDSGVQSPLIRSGNENGVCDMGSGVRGCGDFTPSPCINDESIDLRSPIGSFETSKTVVGSNQNSIVIVEEPKVGMVFTSWQDVEAFYKEYGEQKGFGVSRVQGVLSKGERRHRIFTTWRCECYGKPDMRAQREAKKRAKAMGVCGSGGVVGGVEFEDELSCSKRRSKKCDCKAKVYASLNRQGQWEIKGVELEHTNHTPKPSDAKLVKEYRMKNFNSRARKRLENYFNLGVPVSQIHGCFRTEMGGSDPLSYTVKDLQHEVYRIRRLKMEGGDSAAMMTYFQEMQAANHDFFHSQRLDAEGRLKDVLWVDARSRASYEEFGDVLCFDATYLTNPYDLPFVNFVGVNHHGQSILLGSALVSHEDCDTYRWVFQQWLHCMNNTPPKAILTDQAASMRKPLEEVMPTSRHRWCIWHIMRKISEKLGKCERYQYLKVEMKKVVYESFTVMEFENKWNAFIVEYKLQNNDWLCDLYLERHMWVPAFMINYFWAGMKTTQRVESINSFFDGFLTRNTKLCEFPQKYAAAMDKRVGDETDADAKCSKYIRRLVSGFTVEDVFQKIYTDTKFQKVQN